MPPDRTRAGWFQAALRAVADEAHLNVSDAECLRLHGSGIYLLPREDIVVRLVDASDENRHRSRTAVQVTSWLAERGFPAARPAHGSVVRAGEGTIATLWRHLPHPCRCIQVC